MALVELVIALPKGAPGACPALSSALGQRHRPLRIIVCGADASLPLEPCPEGIELALVKTAGSNLAELFNRGAREARAEWLVFVERSELLDPHFVERTLAAAAASPTMGFVATARAFSARCRSAPLRRARLALGSGAGSLVAGPALLRRSALGHGAIFDESLSQGLEHLALGMRLRSAGTGGIFLPEPLVGRADGEPAESLPLASALRRDMLRLLRRYPRLGANALCARPVDAARLLWPGGGAAELPVVEDAPAAPASGGDDRAASAATDAHARPSFAPGALSISVLLVNWNSKDDLAECLRSLEAQTDRDFEAVVVDNGSTDGSLEMIRRDFAWVELEDAGANLGFAEGCNRGIARSRGAWIATLNNDAVADERFVAELREAARHATEQVGMIQARLVFRERPSHTNSTGVVVEPNGVAYDRDFDAPLRAADEPEEIFCATAGAALYRRAMLEATRLPSGYFDRTFFMYFEDVDLGWRCRLAGWSALYLPSALVYHAFHGSAGRHGDDFVVRQCRANRMRCMVKNASPTMIVRSTPRTLRWLGGSMSRRGLSAARDLVDAARSAWQERPLVTALAVRDRRGIERRWLHRPRKVES